MKIIESNTAPNPRRVRIFLAEKNLAIPIEHIDLSETKSGSFAKLNPMQRVPILVLDDGTVIGETMAICRYLEALHPHPPLFGTSPLEIAKIDMWQRRIELGLFFHVAQVLRHTHPRMAPFENPQIPEWADANRPHVQTALEVFDQQLAQSRFVAGDMFSVADITGLVAVDFMKSARLERPAHLENIARWHDEVSARASTSA